MVTATVAWFIVTFLFWGVVLLSGWRFYNGQFGVPISVLALVYLLARLIASTNRANDSRYNYKDAEAYRYQVYRYKLLFCFFGPSAVVLYIFNDHIKNGFTISEALSLTGAETAALTAIILLALRVHKTRSA